MGQADTTFALYARSTPPLPFLDRVGSPAASKALGKSVVDRFSDPAAARFHTEEMSFLAADPWSATIFLSASRENGVEHDPSSVSDRICLVGLIFIYFSLIRASRCSLNILCYFRYYFKKSFLFLENIWFRLIDNIFLSPAIYFLITNIRVDKVSSVRY